MSANEKVAATFNGAGQVDLVGALKASIDRAREARVSPAAEAQQRYADGEEEYSDAVEYPEAGEPLILDLPIGTPVTYWPGFREGDGIKSVTRSNVWDLCGTPVVMVRGAAGGIALTHIERRELDDGDREPDRPADWVEGNRRLFIDFPDESASVARRERIAEVLLGHQMEWVEGAKTFDCSCNEDGSLDWMGTITEAVQHQLDAMLAAGALRDEATVKAEAIREVSATSRRNAANSFTRNGRYENEAIADWLDEQADAIDPAVVEGAHP